MKKFWIILGLPAILLFKLELTPCFSAEGPRAIIEINVRDEKTGKFVPNAAVNGTFTDENGTSSTFEEKATDARGQVLNFSTVNGKFTMTVTAPGFDAASAEGEVKGTDVKVSRRVRSTVLLKRPGSSGTQPGSPAPAPGPSAGTTASPAAPAIVPTRGFVESGTAVSASSTAVISTPTAQPSAPAATPMTKEQIYAETQWDDSGMHSAFLDSVFYETINLGWAADKLKSASPAFQESFLRGLIQIVKAYASGEGFAKDYLQRRREWYRIEDNTDDENYPKSANDILKKKIKRFLDESATVDFNAKTEDRYGRIVFVSAEHERKSYIWKKCFRAGPRLTKIARDFALEWQAGFTK